MPVTQGILSNMSFDVDTAAFSAEFIYSVNAIAYSTAYLNQEYWYTAGPTVTITVNDTTVIDPATVQVGTTEGANYFSFDMARFPDIKDGDKVTITAA